ncbi:Ribosomal protein S23/S29 mitochondrial [Trinorchestia longiramus]|nr:Ribosomal protein S23/S29 mitochondrial [Trinorchestia longiramus]
MLSRVIRNSRNVRRVWLSQSAEQRSITTSDVSVDSQPAGTPPVAASELPALTFRTSHLAAKSMPYLEPYTTTEDDPRKHTEEHLGLWYTISEDEFKRIFHPFCLRKTYNELVETFNESSLMIRRPALSVINYIKQLNLKSITPPRFIFYGAYGTGKSCCLAHVVHFLSREEFVLLQVPWVDRWLKQFLKKPNEIVPSSKDPAVWDHITDASDWLKFFLTQNKEILSKLKLTSLEEYQFSSREQFPAGSDIVQIAELGIKRPRLAAAVVVAITTEIKKLATQDKCKVAVVMDGINSIFTEDSIYTIDHVDFYTKQTWKYIPGQSFTIVQAFMSLLKSDWHNGVIVGSVDYAARKDKDLSSHHPRYILGEQGWEVLDPFVPVPVPEYSKQEFESAFAYYASKHWIQKHEAITPAGRAQIAALTQRNPFYLLEALGPL